MPSFSITPQSSSWQSAKVVCGFLFILLPHPCKCIPVVSMFLVQIWLCLCNLCLHKSTVCTQLALMFESIFYQIWIQYRICFLNQNLELMQPDLLLYTVFLMLLVLNTGGHNSGVLSWWAESINVVGLPVKLKLLTLPWWRNQQDHFTEEKPPLFVLLNCKITLFTCKCRVNVFSKSTLVRQQQSCSLAFGQLTWRIIVN